MPRITQLKVQKRDTDRVSVFLDGEYAFSVPILAAANLRREQALSDDEIASFQREGDIHLAYQRAVRYLGFRPRSVAETERYLSGKGTADEVTEEVIGRLETQGYLDDHAFARFWVENRQQFRPRSRRALAYELRQKGVPADVIEAAIDEVGDAEAAWAALNGKFERWAGQEEFEFRQRVMAYLGRRGFGYGVSREMADRAWNEVESAV